MKVENGLNDLLRNTLLQVRATGQYVEWSELLIIFGIGLAYLYTQHRKEKKC